LTKNSRPCLPELERRIPTEESLFGGKKEPCWLKEKERADKAAISFF